MTTRRPTTSDPEVEAIEALTREIERLNHEMNKTAMMLRVLRGA